MNASITDYRPDWFWLNDISRQFLSRDYLLNGETGESRISDIGENSESILKISGFAKKFIGYMKRGWFSLSTPVWSNFGRDRGLPISCFGSYISDSLKSILSAHTEIGMMSKYGGGTSAFMGNIRPRGSVITNNGFSCGSVHFARLYDVETDVISQGSARRGQCACWWPIEHGDAKEIITIRHTGSPIQKLSYGLTITDRWMNEMISGDAEKQELWRDVLISRRVTGYPYLMFIDTANRNAPEEYKKLGLSINHSNLCTEIFLSNNEYESFVCCLSSMNDLYFDEWSKDPEAVETLTYFLDSVMTEFITKAAGTCGMERAVRFSERQRALGIGQIGYHSYLQSKLIPFESVLARSLNVLIAKTIAERTLSASRKMASEYGEPEYLKGSGRRHMTLTAVAPTQSSAAIIGQASESIEPFASNYTIKDKQKLKYTFRNPFLTKRLEELGMNTEAVWDSILKTGGSVQHFNQLPKRDKDVFRTFGEISPMEVVVQAADRQKYIDQGQSLNLWIDPSVPIKEINRLIIEGWKLGVKSFYYHKNENAAQQLTREITACAACEG